MQYKYTLEDGAHFLLDARDVSDLLDILHARTNQSGDGVTVWRVDEMARQLDRGLGHLERELKDLVSEIQTRRAQREPWDGPEEFEPADD